jgi:hypothetical protein
MWSNQISSQRLPGCFSICLMWLSLKGNTVSNTNYFYLFGNDEIHIDTCWRIGILIRTAHAVEQVHYWISNLETTVLLILEGSAALIQKRSYPVNLSCSWIRSVKYLAETMKWNKSENCQLINGSDMAERAQFCFWFSTLKNSSYRFPYGLRVGLSAASKERGEVGSGDLKSTDRDIMQKTAEDLQYWYEFETSANYWRRSGRGSIQWGSTASRLEGIVYSYIISKTVVLLEA